MKSSQSVVHGSVNLSLLRHESRTLPASRTRNVLEMMEVQTLISGYASRVYSDYVRL